MLVLVLRAIDYSALIAGLVRLLSRAVTCYIVVLQLGLFWWAYLQVGWAYLQVVP